MFSRDGYYGSLSLMLVGAVVLVVAEVPGLVRRGAVVALPVLTIAGMAVGALASLYFITREERIWLAPTAVFALVVGVVTWRRPAVRVVPLALATMLVISVAGAMSWWTVDRVRDRNEAEYGSRIIGDLVEGEGARAHAEWQRIDLGPVLHWVTINTEQRHAAYRVSPAAAELAPHLEGWGTRWMGDGCSPPLRDRCEYPGGFFVWVAAGGHLAAGTRRHRRRGAGVPRPAGRRDPCRACDDGRLPCTPPGIAADAPAGAGSTRTTSGHRPTASRRTCSPSRGRSPAPLGRVGARPSAGRRCSARCAASTPRRPSTTGWRAAAAARQWPVAFLTDVYRWGARLGAIPALLGVGIGLGTRRGRRTQGRTALLGALLLVGLASRIATLTVVDATAFDSNLPIYLLPGCSFLVGFLVLGLWALGGIITDRRCERRGSVRRGGPRRRG